MHADVLLLGATVIDGSGSAPVHADVAVTGDRIAAVGELSRLTADTIVDLSGQVLCPGFIDIHTHSDVTLLLDPAGESKVLQGVTTEVTGNCGFSPFPLAPARLHLHADHLDWIAYAPELSLDWRDLTGYAARVHEHRPAINIAPLVGHGAVRLAVLGVAERAATPDEISTMKRLVCESLEQGAFGLSTGLTIVPSAYGDAEEIEQLVKVVANHDALYATHARVAAGPGFADVEEALTTARRTGVRLEFSHLAINEPAKWGRAEDVLTLFEEAERRGTDVGFDVYPYAASSSALTQYLPTWVPAGGIDAMRRRMADHAERERAEKEFAEGFFGGIPWHWDRVVISRIPRAASWALGLTIEVAAAEAGCEPVPFFLDLCLDHGNAVDGVLFYRTEDDVRAFLTHRLSVVGSDGIAFPLDLRGLKPHPRSFGTYPRVLGRYVRDSNALLLSAAVHKMTGAVADRLGIRDRGRLVPGAIADLVAFDPATVADNATFTEPASRPRGISHVLVNGSVVVADGEQTSARPGRVLRRNS
ncbi:N-acyl-D-amino-acid deacylase family protein [Amycolatopsis thermoflava]|uniref:N-acyl-D-amino-acid deacylase family protein n=1 Tax=Amycolatopsis thermoflava TaxID=84480 RepID=UPI00364C644A